MAFHYTVTELGLDFRTTVFTLDFIFDEHIFFCLVRARTIESTVLYAITIFNAEMEEILPEPYILTQKERILQIEAPIEKNVQDNIKFASIVALRNHLVQNKPAGTIREQFIV